jgi:hypothetical protein
MVRGGCATRDLACDRSSLRGFCRVMLSRAANSLMLVFDRVCASTRFTITAQARLGPSALRRKRPRHDYRISGHPRRHEHFAGSPDPRLGGGADEDAHREHRAFLHDHAFGDFGAGADEAIVLDDTGPA